METNEGKLVPQSQNPKTIEELRQWYEMHHLPPEEVTRFFVGKNITEPKAFGIYKNEVGEFVVYKNKANGERAIRYQGTDEAFAVGELLQRLKDEIRRQKSKNRPSTAMRASGSTGKSGSTKSKGCMGIISIIFVALMGLVVNYCDKSVPNGYYNYQGQHYYHQGSSWFLYNALSNDWFRTESLDDRITKDNADDYRTNYFDGKQFEDSQWYEEDTWDSDTDDDDWGGDDSWDSDDSDWDSDW